MEENRLSIIEEYHKIAKIGKRLNFRGESSCNVSFMERTFNSNVCVLPGTTNVFGTDWIVSFRFMELPVNSFCNKVNVSIKEISEETEKNTSDLKNEFPSMFSEDLGQCTKIQG